MYSKVTNLHGTVSSLIESNNISFMLVIFQRFQFYHRVKTVISIFLALFFLTEEPILIIYEII